MWRDWQVWAGLGPGSYIADLFWHSVGTDLGHGFLELQAGGGDAEGRGV